MIDAAKLISPPFTLYAQNQGALAIRRKGSIIHL
jgi:hypothetical protein